MRFQRTLKSISHLRRIGYATFTTWVNASVIVGFVDECTSSKREIPYENFVIIISQMLRDV